MEKGTVMWFSPEPGRRFGKLLVDGGGEKIFFHFARGQFVVAGERGPEFSRQAPAQRDGRLGRLKDPEAGDRFVFDRYVDDRSGKVSASPWGFEEAWLAAEKIVAARPEYRVLELHTESGATPDWTKATVLWQGFNLEEVRRKYKRPTGSVSGDPLIPFWADANLPEIGETRHQWQVMVESWEDCEDPR